MQLPSANGHEEQRVVGSSEAAYRVVLARPQHHCIGTALLVPGSGLPDCSGYIQGFPFLRALSEALLSVGLATVRFGTRPFMGPPPANSLTAEYLAPTSMVLKHLVANGFQRPFVGIGHSLGGHVLPWLANELDVFDGLVLVNAPHRSFREVWNWQLSRLPAAIALLQRARAMDRYSQTDVAHTLTTAALKALRIPLLVVGCGRDLQVPATEFEKWATQTSSIPLAKMAWLADLDHLCLDQNNCVQPAWGPPVSVPKVTSTVSAVLVDAVASWLTQAFPTPSE